MRRQKLRELFVQITGDDADFSAAAKRTEKAVERIGRRTKRATVALTAMGAAAAYLGVQTFQLGADVAETQSKFDVVFGSGAEAMDEWTTRFGRLAGLTRTEGQEIVSRIGAISKGFGMSNEAAEEYSKTLVGLAGDLASLYNTSTIEAANALTSAVAGEREQIKKYGIILREDDVIRRVRIKTGKEMVSQITNEERALASLEIMTERAGVAVGDLARTQDSAANRGKRLSARFRDIRDSVASDLLPTLERLLPVLEGVAERLEDIAPRIAGIVETLAGMTGLIDPELEAMLTSSLNTDDPRILEARYRGWVDALMMARQELRALRAEEAVLGFGQGREFRLEPVREEIERIEAVIRALGERLTALGSAPSIPESLGAGGAGSGAGELDAITKAIDKMNQEMAIAHNRSQLLGHRWDAIAGNIQILETALQELLEAGLEPTDERLIGITKTLERLYQMQDRVNDRMETTRKRMESVREESVNLAASFTDAIGDAALDGMDSFRQWANYALRQIARVAARLAVFRVLSLAFPGSSFVGMIGGALGFSTAGGGGMAAAASVPMPVVNNSLSLNISGMPAAANPMAAARDAQWLDALSRSLKELKRNGEVL